MAIRKSAESNRRSLNSEVLYILDCAAAAEAGATPAKAPAKAPARAQARARAKTDGVRKVNRAGLAGVCRKYHVRWLAMFGSRARGDARAGSDVDLVVDFEEGKTPGFGMVALAGALSPLFGGTRVDLFTRRGLPRETRDDILREAVTLHDA